jgi:hypothetical protein
MLAVDLFAGTGSATLAFREAGWNVIEIDLSAEHDVDGRRLRVRADCRRLPLSGRLAGAVDFLWASPPCTEFSDANARLDHLTKHPSMDLVAATLHAVSLLRPRFWILENVRGAIPLLGIPVQKIGPFCLWGYFPEIDASWDSGTYRKSAAGRSAIARAVVPPSLSRAVYAAVDRSQHLASILDLRPFRRHRKAAARARAAGPATPGLWPGSL